MSRFHVKNDGKPGKCTAQPGNCPLGGAHFDNLNDAYAYAEKQYEEATLKGYYEEVTPENLLAEQKRNVKKWVKSRVNWRARDKVMEAYEKLETENPEALEPIRKVFESTGGYAEITHLGADGSFTVKLRGTRIPEAIYYVSRSYGEVEVGLARQDTDREYPEGSISRITSRYSDDLRDIVSMFDKVDSVKIGRFQDFVRPNISLKDGDDFTESEGAKMVSSFEVAPNGTVFHRTEFYNTHDQSLPPNHFYSDERRPAVLVYADDDKNIEYLYDDSHEFHGEIDGEPRKQLRDFYESKDYQFDTDFIRHSRQNGLFKLLKDKMAHDPNPEDADFRWAEKSATAFAIGKSGEQILMDLPKD